MIKRSLHQEDAPNIKAHNHTKQIFTDLEEEIDINIRTVGTQDPTHNNEQIVRQKISKKTTKLNNTTY